MGIWMRGLGTANPKTNNARSYRSNDTANRPRYGGSN